MLHGRNSELFSVLCPNKVLSIKGSICDHGQLVELANYEEGNRFQQWKRDRFNNIYSVECGRTRVLDSSDGSVVRLTSRRNTGSQVWTYSSDTRDSDEVLVGVTCLYSATLPVMMFPHLVNCVNRGIAKFLPNFLC